MTRRYVVFARDWNSQLQDRFGNQNSVHELTDTEIVDAIIKHGRAEIGREGLVLTLEFQNDYD